MSTLRINWSYDTYDCDQCGTSWDTGAVVTLDSYTILNAPASASCMGGENVDYERILRALCEHLKIAIVENNS